MQRILSAFFIFIALSGLALAQPVSRYAMVVGIGDYPKESRWPSLHAHIDAQKMKALLRKKGFLEANILMLTNQQATYQNIRLAFKKILEDAEPEDQVLIYLGGHSQKITDLSGDEEDRVDEAFVPYDASTTYKPVGCDGSTHLLDDEMGEWINLIGEKVTRLGSLFILYDGGIAGAKAPGKGGKGTMPAFKIPGGTKESSPGQKRNFDNDWLDLSYTEENNQLATLDPGEPQNCPNAEVRLTDGKFGSGLVAGFIAATEKKEAVRFRDINPSLRQMAKGCAYRLDGALQQEIFKSAERQFSPSAEAEKEGAADGQIYSIVIGVSKYQNVDPLQFGNADASLFHSILVSQNGVDVKPENQYLFIDSTATIKPVIDALEEISNKVKEGDRIYFYFAGHGDVENLLSRKAHLLLYNSPANVYKAGGTLPVEYVKDYFQQWIYRKARVFLVVDACKSGNLAGGLEGGRATVASLKEIGTNSARLLSCQPNEKSEESDAFGGGHGAFTYYMVKGLMGMANQNGDQKISIQEIGTYLTDSVSMATARHQNPMVEGNQKLTFLPLVQEASLINQPTAFNAQASRSGSIASEDSIKVRWLKELRKHLASQAIVEPANHCAKATFDRISNVFPLENRFLKSVAQEVQSVIDKKSQVLINAYIQGDEKVATETAFALATREVHFLLDITPMSDPLYFMYLSRSYFFEGRSIQPVLVDNDLTRYKLNEAIRNLRKSLSYEPEGAQNHNAIGRLQQANRQYPEAITSYRKAMALAPTWKFPINNLATVFDEYAAVSNTTSLADSAVLYFRKALDIDPRFEVAHKNLGITYFNKGQSELAKKQYRLVLRLNPMYTEAYLNMGSVFRQEQKWDSAVFYLNLGLESSPANPDLMSDMGNVYFDQIATRPDLKPNLLKESSTWYRKALQQNQWCMEALIGMGHVFWEKKTYDSAARYYKSLVLLDSNTASYQNYLIEALLRGGKLAEAEKMAMRLAKNQPKDAMNWFDMGVLAVLQGNSKLATSRFQKSIDLGLSEKSVYNEEPLLQTFLKSKEFLVLQKQLR